MPATPTPSATRIAEPNSSFPVIVYVTDDNRLLRIIFSDVLTEGGYQVLEVGNASHALLLLEARSDIHLLLADVNVPGEINGFLIARQVQQRWPEIGIILMSGGEIADPGDVPEGRGFKLRAGSDPQQVPVTSNGTIQAFEEFRVAEP